MATKKNTNRFVLTSSGMKNIHTAPVRAQRKGESAKRSKSAKK